MNEDAYVSDEEELECPLCMEEFDISDRTFKPCPCGYQICRFCYNRIVNSETANGCPACRRQYTEETVEFKPLSAEEWKRDQQRIHSRKLKEKEKRESEMASRRHLSNMRVVQKNLVYVIGFSPKSADADLAATLRGNDYFAQYGKINKIVVNKKSHPNGQPTVGVYITYAKKEDAARAVQAVDNTMNDGRVLRASFGTTKYCSAYLRQQVCQNPNCMYLHEPGEDLDSYTREDMSTIQHAAKAAEGMHANALAAHHMRRQPSHQDSTGTSNQDDGGVALPATASWASMPKPSESTQTAQEAGQTSGNDQEHTKPDSLPPPAKGGHEGQGQIPPPPSQAAQGSIHPSELLPPPVQPGIDHPILGSTLKTFFEGRFNFNFVPRVVPGLSEADIKSAESFPQLFAWNPQQRRPASPSKMGKNHARSGSRYAFAADSRTPPPGFIPPGLATGSQPPGFTGGSRQAKDGSPDFFSQFLRNANPSEEPNATQPNYDDPAILGRSESLKSPPLMAANNSTNGRSSQSRVEAGQRHSSNGSQTTGPSQVSATALADMPSQTPGKPASGLGTPEIEKPQSKFGASFAKLENLEHQAQEMTARTDQKARGMWEPTTRSKDELSRPTLATMAQSADVHLEVPNPRMLPKSSGTWQPSPPPPKGLMSPSPKPNAVLTGVSKVGPSMKNASKVPWEPSPPPSTIARAGSPRKTVPLGNSGLNASSSNNDARTQSAILTPDEFPSLQSVTNAVELIAPVAQTPARKTWDPVAPVAVVPIPPQTPKGRAALSRRDSTMSLASSGPDHGRSRQNSLIEPPLSRFGTPSHETSPGSSPLVSRAASPVTTPQLNRTLSSLVATPAVSSPLANLNTGKQIRIVSSKSVDEAKAKEEKAAAEQKAIQKMKDDEIAAAAAKSTIRKSVPASSVKKTKEQKQAEQREKAERRERESTVSSQPDETPVAIPTEIAPIVGRARKQKNKQQQQQAQHKTHASPSRPSMKQATPEVSEAEAEVEAEVEEGEEEEEATTTVSVPAGESTKTAAASDAITALAKELDLRQFKFFQPIPSLNHGFEFSAEEIAKAEELAVYTKYDARESVAVLERYLAEARRDVLERFKAVEKCQRRNLKFANVSMIQSS